MQRTLLAVCAASLVLASGCDTTTRAKDNPLGTAANRTETPYMRKVAVDTIREQRAKGEGANPQAVLKDIAWAFKDPPAVRAAAVDALLNDPDPAIAADAREMGRLLLPRDPSREVVNLLCRTAMERGWTEYIPALVRSAARPVPESDDATRSELVALRALGGGRSVEQIAFDVFMTPPKATDDKLDWQMRSRADAWDLLARLDADGSKRAQLLAAAESPGEDPILAALGACRRDLRTVPLSGDELTWLASLRKPEKKDNTAWWREAAAAVAQVPTDVGDLRLRHVEAIRWAAAYRPQLLKSSRAELLGQIKSMLAKRTTHRRVEKEGPNTGPIPSELIENRESELSWGDCLSIIVIDGAMREPQVVAAFFAQAQGDAADTTTEYGGLLAFKRGSEKATCMCYPPRPAQRQGDERFVASDDMIAAGDLALAHYHFHVQREKNEDYAGPSARDLDYATRFGRSCIVFTSVRRGVMNADYYQPGNTVIDLGEIAEGQ